MPMRSKAQRRYLHAAKPEVAKKFESKTSKGAKLPEKKRRKRKSGGRKSTGSGGK